jgi:hypothetical protein
VTHPPDFPGDLATAQDLFGQAQEEADRPQPQAAHVDEHLETALLVPGNLATAQGQCEMLNGQHDIYVDEADQGDQDVEANLSVPRKQCNQYSQLSSHEVHSKVAKFLHDTASKLDTYMDRMRKEDKDRGAHVSYALGSFKVMLAFTRSIQK